MGHGWIRGDNGFWKFGWWSLHQCSYQWIQIILSINNYPIKKSMGSLNGHLLEKVNYFDITLWKVTGKLSILLFYHSDLNVSKNINDGSYICKKQKRVMHKMNGAVCKEKICCIIALCETVSNGILLPNIFHFIFIIPIFWFSFINLHFIQVAFNIQPLSGFIMMFQFAGQFFSMKHPDQTDIFLPSADPGHDNEWLSLVHRQVGHLSYDGYKKPRSPFTTDESLWNGGRGPETTWYQIKLQHGPNWI